VVAAYSIDDWVDDITKAKAVGIDGFALNIGPQDDYTTRQINLAADAANQVRDFTLFLSFDYLTAGYPWDAGVVTSMINDFATKAGSAQYRYNNKPLVSTFEGVNSAGDWAAIKANTGCFFVPDWTSASPTGIPQANIDGAFSWDAWPHGPVGKDKSSDLAWQAALGAKPYMMGVSPWFYTNLPGKNWGLRGDGLWSTRWQQAVELQPAFVQVRDPSCGAHGSMLMEVDRLSRGTTMAKATTSAPSSRRVCPRVRAATSSPIRMTRGGTSSRTI
jgi:aminopeptidase I